ncbi:MAG: hypothetical protein HGA66_17615, partial [Holophaga sp.]|nr:hypothetical protein [Holophaga sp.]
MSRIPTPEERFAAQREARWRVGSASTSERRRKLRALMEALLARPGLPGAG